MRLPDIACRSVGTNRYLLYAGPDMTSLESELIYHASFLRALARRVAIPSPALRQAKLGGSE